MHICYIDESGCTGSLKSTTDSVQPLFAVLALWIQANDVPRLTREFIALKRRYFPHRSHPQASYLSDILWEVKGADLRREIREGDRQERRRAVAFLDDTVDLVAKLHCHIAAKVFIKEIGRAMDGTGMSTSSIQYLFTTFQDYLTGQNERGVVVADCRSKAINVSVSHSIFTQRFKSSGDQYNRILELPLFANTDNHAGLQVADLLCSALLFPIAAYSYCLGHVNNVHVSQEYELLKNRYGSRLQQLQHRYRDGNDRYRGGVTVSDALLKRPGSVLFR